MQTISALRTNVMTNPAPLIKGWSSGQPDQLRQIPSGPDLGATRSLGKDEEIYAEGDASDRYFRVISGMVRLCKLLDDGRRQICAFATAGDLFGVEFGGTHGFSAEAVCDAVVVSYRRGRLDTLANGSGRGAGELLAWALRGLERAQRHMLLLGRKSALEKVASFLCDMAERADIDAIDLSMSRTDIADYLGLTIETVSRTLTQLEREHIIELPANRRSIILRNKAKLRRLCE